MADCIPMNL